MTPPGPPTQHGIYASPEWTGQPYPSLGWQNIRQDQEPPEGWPRPPKFNELGDDPRSACTVWRPDYTTDRESRVWLCGQWDKRKEFVFLPPRPLGKFFVHYG